MTRFNQAMAEETEGLRLDEGRLRAGVLAGLEDPEKGSYYLAEAEGEVVGQLMLTREWSDWRNGYFWWIQSVYVAPAARGQGVYRKLHEAVEHDARAAANVCGLRLYVDRGNANAKRVYEKLGMRQTDYELYEVDWRRVEGEA